MVHFLRVFSTEGEAPSGYIKGRRTAGRRRTQAGKINCARPVPVTGPGHSQPRAQPAVSPARCVSYDALARSIALVPFMLVCSPLCVLPWRFIDAALVGDSGPLANCADPSVVPGDLCPGISDLSSYYLINDLSLRSSSTARLARTLSSTDKHEFFRGARARAPAGPLRASAICIKNTHKVI